MVISNLHQPQLPIQHFTIVPRPHMKFIASSAYIEHSSVSRPSHTLCHMQHMSAQLSTLVLQCKDPRTRMHICASKTVSVSSMSTKSDVMLHDGHSRIYISSWSVWGLKLMVFQRFKHLAAWHCKLMIQHNIHQYSLSHFSLPLLAMSPLHQ